MAQEGDQTDPNRANILAWIEYVRNGNMPELSRLLYTDAYTVYSPFAPQGSAVSIDDIIADETVMHSAFPDIEFTHYLVLAESNQTAFVGYQEGTFTNEYYGAQPTGERVGYNMMVVSTYFNGQNLADYAAWNSQLFNQDMGWAEDEYTLTSQPWDVRLGETSTTPAEHHRTLQAFLNQLASGVNAPENYALAYHEDVVVHDYLGDLSGITELMAAYDPTISLPGFRGVQSEIVCEGDLCVSWEEAVVPTSDGDVALVWSALHRFVDGKIAEEWWLYDNAALWSLNTPA
jgi:predicted ester cyclase